MEIDDGYFRKEQAVINELKITLSDNIFYSAPISNLKLSTPTVLISTPEKIKNPVHSTVSRRNGNRFLAFKINDHVFEANDQDGSWQNLKDTLQFIIRQMN